MVTVPQVFPIVEGTLRDNTADLSLLNLDPFQELILDKTEHLF